jgi:hypothetical protein
MQVSNFDDFYQVNLPNLVDSLKKRRYMNQYQDINLHLRLYLTVLRQRAIFMVNALLLPAFKSQRILAGANLAEKICTELNVLGAKQTILSQQ